MGSSKRKGLSEFFRGAVGGSSGERNGFKSSSKDVFLEPGEVSMKFGSEERIFGADIRTEGIVFAPIKQQKEIALGNRQKVDDALGAG